MAMDAGMGQRGDESEVAERVTYVPSMRREHSSDGRLSLQGKGILVVYLGRSRKLSRASDVFQKTTQK